MEEEPVSRPNDNVDSLDIILLAIFFGIPCTIPEVIPGANPGCIPCGIPWSIPDVIPVTVEEVVWVSLHFLLLLKYFRT